MSKSNVKYTEAEALEYHARGRPGKIEIIATKPMATQRDLALAYSPGVAVPVRAIADDPGSAYDYTAKGNLVAVISNGTAILGLGNLGALAAKPVMEARRCCSSVSPTSIRSTSKWPLTTPRSSSTRSHCSSRASAGSTSRTLPRPTAS
jgi:hypothetical protein